MLTRQNISHLKEEEKCYIRSRLFDLIMNSNSKQVLRQISSLIARIARLDFPRDWPNLFEDLKKVLDDSLYNSPVQLNMYSTSIQVVKALSTAKVGSAKRALHEKCPEMLKAAIQSYMDSSAVLLAGSASSNTDENQLEISFISLKLAVRIMTDGIEQAHRLPNVQGFFTILSDHFKRYIQLLATRNLLPNVSGVISKHVKLIGKLLIRLFDLHPAGLILLISSTQFISLYMSISRERASLPNQSEDDDDRNFWKSTITQGLVLIHKLVQLKSNHRKIMRYRTQLDREEAEQAIGLLNSTLLAHEVILEVAELVVGTCMVLQTEDLQMWACDPEEFVLEESDINWEFHMRACASKLYGDLTVNYKPVVNDRILQFVSENLDVSQFHHALSQPNNLNAVLRIDCALQALELGMAALNEQITFDNLLENIIFPLGQLQHVENIGIIRRRLTLVISDWISIDCVDSNRVLIYQMLLSFLDSGNDLVVKLYAIQAIRYSVDDYNFKLQLFIPFIGPILNNLLSTIRFELNEIESKLEVLKVIALIIERIEFHSEQFIESILAELDQIWNEDLIKPVVLQILKSLVENCDSSKARSLALMVISASLNDGNLVLVLLEDCLPLWQSVISMTKNPEEDRQLGVMYETVLPVLFDRWTEYLPLELQVFESYILLSPSLIISLGLSDLFSIFAKYIKSMKQDIILYFCQTLDWLALLCPLSNYDSTLLSSGLFEALIHQCADDEDNEYVAQAKVYGILARMAYNDPIAFWKLIRQAPSFPLDRFWNKWVNDIFETVGNPRDQKLHVLGITALFSSGDGSVMAHLERIISIWIDTTEIMAFEDNEPKSPKKDETVNVDRKSPEDLRKANILTMDPVNTVRLQDAIRMNLQLVHRLSSTHQHRIDSVNQEYLRLLYGILQT